MDFGQHPVDWKGLFRRRGFSFLFAAMFISLFGTGMNYAAVTWYVLEQTDSTVSVGLMIILLTLPGLVVPPFGGVLIDRVDRRYLGMALDVLRSLVVLAAAGLIFLDIGTLWPVYAMVMVLGAGFAVYWSTMNALVQEFVLPNHLVGANAAVLIAVQTGMMSAGAVVGFLYERLHVTGILAIDGITYLASALCLLALRQGYFAPQHHDVSPTIEAPPAPAPADQPVLPPIVEPGVVMGFLADLREGWHYLRDQPLVRALGL
ncbi:MAG TPA: MFS transporter, partial [Candidatus Acidoferrales bacterium]